MADVQHGDEQPQTAERYFCPECGSWATGPNDLCSGSFTDRDHPSNVRPERDCQVNPQENLA